MFLCAWVVSEVEMREIMRNVKRLVCKCDCLEAKESEALGLFGSAKWKEVDSRDSCPLPLA